jgi:outer membrane protein TolC
MKIFQRISWVGIMTFAPAFGADEVFLDRMGFENFVEAATKEGPHLKTQEEQVRFSEARENYASSNYYPIIQADLAAGPSPAVQGDALGTTTDWGDWNVAFEGKLQIVQPLLHWWTVSKAVRAARSGTTAEKALLEREKWSLRYEVARYYFGYQFAFEMRELAEEVGEELNKALKNGEDRRKKKQSGAPTLGDLDRLRGYVVEAEVRKAEAQKGIDLARMAMGWKLGTLGTKTPRWDRANLEIVERVLPPLGDILDLAKKSRPEFTALSAEEEARRLLADVEEAKGWPMVYAGFQGTYAKAPNREDQESVFANDPYNKADVVLGIGVRWHPFSAEARAQASMARAEWRKAEAKSLNLRMGLAAEVEQKYREFSFNQERRKLRKTANDASGRVFQDHYSGFFFGTVKAKDLLEVMGENVMARKNYLEAIYDENLSWIALQQVAASTLDGKTP